MAREIYTPTPAKFSTFIKLMDQLDTLMYRYNLIIYYRSLKHHVSKNKSYSPVIPSPDVRHLNANSLAKQTGMSWAKSNQLILAWTKKDNSQIKCSNDLQFKKDLCLLLALAEKLAQEVLTPDQIPENVNSVELKKLMPDEEEQKQVFYAFAQLAKAVMK